nr:protein SDA1 homolog isoform X2 [Tanacetum cinerariifolium]
MSMTATGLITDEFLTCSRTLKNTSVERLQSSVKHNPSSQTESKEVDRKCTENCKEGAENITQGDKGKFGYCHEELDSGSQSRGVLKRLAGAKVENDDTSDGILSNEDFHRIKVLKAKKEAERALNSHGINYQDPKRRGTKFKQSGWIFT